MTEKRPPIRLGSESMGKKRFQCPAHWTLAQRLDHYTDKSGGPDACWPWTGSRNTYDYGHLRWHGKMRLTHRLTWTEAHGPIPPGLDVLHHCDNPPCRNDAHLFLGDNDDNVEDRNTKGRQCRGERCHAAKLTETEIRKIRAAIGKHRDIAKQFGVSHAVIGKILRREAWVHVK